MRAMPLSDRENFLRNARFEGPEWIPAAVHLSGALWLELREELEKVLARHPVLFPDFEKGRRDFEEMELDARHRAGERLVDAWGSVWENEIDGIVGQVVEPVLDDWAKFESYRPPDPLTTNDQNPPVDWEAEARKLERARAEGRLARGGLPHGHFFMRLYYLRGFENLMLDIAGEDPRLERLIEMVADYCRARVEKWLSLGVEYMYFGEDLGTQTASMISPQHFARYVTPVYKDLFGRCKARGVVVKLHADGHLLELVDELLSSGVDILNPQDLCNGVDEIARAMKGRVCIDLDIDRQKVVPFGKPAEIRELIEEEVRKLGSPQGGLSFTVGMYPPTPPENVDAVLGALEDFRTFWSGGRGK
jgi:hypothetical protein